MNEFLANYYKTAGQTKQAQEETVATDDLEKMAQLTILAQDAQAQGIDLSHLSDEELLKLAEDHHQETTTQTENASEEEKMQEKIAAAKFEEADFLGRAMAHSMWQELGEIQKEAQRSGPKLTEEGARAYERYAGGLGERLQETQEEAAKPKGVLGKVVAKAKGVGKQVAETAAKYPRTATALKIGLPAAAALGVGTGVGRATKGEKKEKAASAFDQLVQARAYDHLAAAGMIDDQGNVAAPTQTKEAADFDTVVDTNALQYLESLGYPIEWNNQ